jgi:hypothetical protein
MSADAVTGVPTEIVFDEPIVQAVDEPNFVAENLTMPGHRFHPGR